MCENFRKDFVKKCINYTHNYENEIKKLEEKIKQLKELLREENSAIGACLGCGIWGTSFSCKIFPDAFQEDLIRCGNFCDDGFICYLCFDKCGFFDKRRRQGCDTKDVIGGIQYMSIGYDEWYCDRC